MKNINIKLTILSLIGLIFVFCVLMLIQNRDTEKPSQIVPDPMNLATRVKSSNQKSLPDTGSESDISDFPTSRNATPTVMLDLKHLKNIVFQERKLARSPDGKHWNSMHTMNLTRNSVWYDLYSRDGKFIKKLPRYINVDPTCNPLNTDYMADDIHWIWLDNKRIIGVQEIYYRDSPYAYEGIQREMTIPAPHGARVYLFDVDNLDIVYELKTPKLPNGLAVHLDGITDEGYISLSGASPIVYHQGNSEISKNPKYYQYIGVFQIMEK